MHLLGSSQLLGSTRPLTPWLPEALVPLMTDGLQSLDDDLLAQPQETTPLGSTFSGLIYLSSSLLYNILGMIKPIIQMRNPNRWGFFCIIRQPIGSQAEVAVFSFSLVPSFPSCVLNDCIFPKGDREPTTRFKTGR